MNYYNEFDPDMAAWLQELIAEGLIPAGEVDERSILDVRPHELYGFTQHHFFCGIGGWPLALRLAGWPDSRPVKSASCPCQPFSIAGLGKGTADERHLWPYCRDLVTFGEATVIFGEQVASADGRTWCSGVRADMEALGYAFGAADLCAAGVGAPHPRQRLYWVADGTGKRRGQKPADSRRSIAGGATEEWAAGFGARGSSGGMGDADGSECNRLLSNGNATGAGGSSNNGRLVHTNSDGCEQGIIAAKTAGYRDPADSAGSWADSYWLLYRDGKHRRVPVESEIFPLADGLPYKLARRRSARGPIIKGAGNAIVPELAAVFIRAFLSL